MYGSNGAIMETCLGSRASVVRSTKENVKNKFFPFLTDSNFYHTELADLAQLLSSAFSDGHSAQLILVQLVFFKINQFTSRKKVS